MNEKLGTLLLATLALACEGPDPTRDGFVLIDERAAAAGIELEIDGERHPGRLPLVVPEGAEAAIRRPSGAEPLAVGAGELVQVVGAAGEIQRGEVPRDQIWVQGEAASVSAFAEMIGASATRLPGGGWAVEGPDAFVLASLMGGLTDVRALSGRPDPSSDVIDVGVFLGPRTPAAPALEAPMGPVPDAAALVGLYTHDDVSLLLDAAGGYVLSRGVEHRLGSGTYRPRPGGVDFMPNDGGAGAVMDLDGGALVDDLGIGFRAVEGEH